MTVDLDRSQVGEECQLFAQPENGLLGSDRGLRVVPFRPADGTEQDGVAFFGEPQGRVRQGHAVFVNRTAARRGQLKRKGNTKS